jgi:hypothetical protein
MKVPKGDSSKRHPNETLEVQPAKTQHNSMHTMEGKLISEILAHYLANHIYRFTRILFGKPT